MSMPVPPALGFYLEHSADVDALESLAASPPGLEEDWQKFQDVCQRANEHATELLLRCRDAAVRALSPDLGVGGTANARPTIRRDWEAWTGLTLKAPSQPGRPPLVGWLGVALARDSAGKHWMLVYVGPEGGSGRLDELRVALARHEAIKKADEEFAWWPGRSSYGVVIAGSMLLVTTDLDALCKELSAAVAKRAADVAKAFESLRTR